MRKTKKVLSTLLSLCMVLSMVTVGLVVSKVPASALYNESGQQWIYPVWVTGTNITAADSLVSGTSGTYYYDPSTGGYGIGASYPLPWSAQAACAANGIDFWYQAYVNINGSYYAMADNVITVDQNSQQYCIDGYTNTQTASGTYYISVPSQGNTVTVTFTCHSRMWHNNGSNLEADTNVTLNFTTSCQHINTTVTQYDGSQHWTHCNACGSNWGHAGHADRETGRTPATCVSGGTVYHRCDSCGYEWTTGLDVDPNNHASGQYYGETPATCTAPGYEAGYYCSACGQWYSGHGAIQQLSHKWGTYSHVEDGDGNPANDRHSAACTYNCGTTNTQSCTFVDQAFSASCTAQGYTHHTCSVCGFEYDDAYTDLLPHTYSVYVAEVTPATCTVNATATYKCANCTATTVKSVPDTKLPHSYTGSAVSNGSGKHSRKCVNGCNSYGDLTDCTYTEKTFAATCAKGSYTAYTCPDCGYTYESAEANDKLSHVLSYESNEDGTHTASCANCDYTATEACSDFTETPHAATCAKGSYTTYVCKDCGYTYDGEEANDKLPHDLSYVNNENGTHTASCANCDYTATVDCSDFNETPHAATCAKGSYTTYECKDCGYTYDGEEANDKLPHDLSYVNNEDGTHTASCANCDYTNTADCSDFNETPHAATCAKGSYTTYECKACGYTYDGEEANDKLPHELSYTNNEDGTHTASCANCDYTVTVDCSDFTETPHAATCAKGSYTTYVCKDCGYTYDGEEANDKLPHELSYTNNEDGTHTANCANCDYSATTDCADFNETPHAATCAKGSYTTYECKACGYTYDGEEANDKLPHELSYTNNEDGTHTAHCANCDYSATTDCADFNETPHAATCAKGSYTTYECKDCGYTYDGAEANDKLDHDYLYTPNGDGTHSISCRNCDFSDTADCTGGEATCVEKARCEVCGGEYGDYGEHAYGDWTQISDTEHQRVCANDPNHKETAAHTWDNGVETGNATCLEPSHKLFTCTACGATKEEDTAYGAHTMTQHVAYKAPTCVADGNPEYWYCATCEKYYLSADGSDEGQTTAPVLHDENAHKFGEMVREVSATCTAAGVKAHKTCEYCGNDFDADGVKLDTLVIPMLEHDYGAWIDEESAGCTTAGTKGHYTCSMCGDDFDAEKNVIEDLTIPATGHTFPLIHVDAKEAGCPNHAALHAPRRSGTPVTITGYNGNIEYWYCEACGAYFADAEGEHEITAADIVIPAAHHMTHVAYKAPTTEAEGNREYWICEICGDYFADADGSRQIADKSSVVLPKQTPVEPDDGGNTTPGGRISIWDWLIRFFRKILSMFSGSNSIC